MKRVLEEICCSNCGRECTPGEKECPHCGSEIVESTGDTDNAHIVWPEGHNAKYVRALEELRRLRVAHILHDKQMRRTMHLLSRAIEKKAPASVRSEMHGICSRAELLKIRAARSCYDIISDLGPCTVVWRLGEKVRQGVLVGHFRPSLLPSGKFIFLSPSFLEVNEMTPTGSRQVHVHINQVLAFLP